MSGTAPTRSTQTQLDRKERIGFSSNLRELNFETSTPNDENRKIVSRSEKILEVDQVGICRETSGGILTFSSGAFSLKKGSRSNILGAAQLLQT
jgi:hypothetical protein